MTTSVETTTSQQGQMLALVVRSDPTSRYSCEVESSAGTCVTLPKDIGRPSVQQAQDHFQSARCSTKKKT